MKTFFDIKRIREDRSSLSMVQISEFAERIVDQATEIVADFFYEHPEENATRVTLSFERDPVLEEMSGADERDARNCILCIEDEAALAYPHRTSPAVQGITLLSVYLTHSTYEKNRHVIIGKIKEYLEKEGYQIIQNDNEDIIVVGLQ